VGCSPLSCWNVMQIVRAVSRKIAISCLGDHLRGGGGIHRPPTYDK
jgi:hypothetical protein